jgi:hypothetical protein
MCTDHWRAYVKGLREARMAAKASDEASPMNGGEEFDAAPWRLGPPDLMALTS